MLEVTGLKSGYGEGLVLHGLSLQVGPGELVGLLGRNGAGKSTLLKTIMGLIKAREGSITFNDRDITNLAPYQVAAAEIGYVPQGREIFADFTVAQNLLLGNLKADHDNLESVFDLFPVLRERAASRAGSLSGGQQQQLALARALMGTPRLLLLDEPSEGIQPSIVAEIARTLKTIAEREAIAIILVEQNVDMVCATCSRAAFLEAGTIAAELPASELAGNPDLLHRYMAL